MVKTRKGGAGDVSNVSFQTEYQHVLSNAILPGILYGWGVRLSVYAPHEHTGIGNCVVLFAICPGASKKPRVFSCSKMYGETPWLTRRNVKKEVRRRELEFYHKVFAALSESIHIDGKNRNGWDTPCNSDWGSLRGCTEL